MKWLVAIPVIVGAALLLAKKASAAQGPDPTYLDGQGGGILDGVSAMAADFEGSISGSPAEYFRTSDAMQKRLKKREGLRLERYRLGDGGWTIGYGRFYPDSGDAPPEVIDLATAEQWFSTDLVDRGEKWVKAYVAVPISQSQFDALVSMAYNLRPSSFKKIAEAVNAGQDPAPVAMQYTRPGTNLENGLIARRSEELGIYNGTIEA